MSEDRERSKISLRSGKRKGRPQISAPRQISEPILQDGSGPLMLAPLRFSQGFGRRRKLEEER
ncbi:exocyst complex component EXO84 [Colletotrichum tofieldiae]|nr:exocyst complex component EXO84 [Colletotrichum tofieldiae]